MGRSASVNRIAPTVLEYLATAICNTIGNGLTSRNLLALVRKSGVEYDPRYLFG